MCGKTLVRVTGLVGVLVPLLAASAQAVGPVGPQFLINTGTENDQGNGQQSSCGYGKYRSHGVASDAAGDFVVVWQSEDQDGDGLGVFAQRFDASGGPLGSEFQVNQTTVGRQWTPVVAMDAAGSFVVAWHSSPLEEGGDIFARRFDSSGNPLGGEFQVSSNAYPYGPYTNYAYYATRNPAIETDGGGNFVIAWEREGDTYDGRDVMAHRFDAVGNPMGGVFQVSEPGYYDYGDFHWNRTPDVAVAADGKFVITWTSIPAGLGGYSVVAQRFQADGSPAGSEFQVNTTGTYYGYPFSSYFESSPDVKFDATGKFLVVWSSSWIEDESQSGRYDVGARLFHGNGAPTGPQFRVNEPAVGYEYTYDGCPVVDRLADGNFVVAWNSYGDHDGYYGSVAKARIVDGGGNATGLDQLVNTDPDRGYSGSKPAVAAQGSDFVVVFTDNSLDGSGGLDGYEMFGQRFSQSAGQSVSCAVLPKSDCRDLTQPLRARLTISRGATPARSSIKWSWTKGAAFSPEDLGDPFNDTSYAFCLYDGSSQAVLSLHAPRGGTCAGFPCWRELTGSGPPIEYYHRQSNQDGLVRLRLGPGADGATRASALAKGASLDLPDQPLVAPVIAQVQSSLGECWTSRFGDFIQRNDGTKFIAKSE